MAADYAITLGNNIDPSSENSLLGFRVATFIPEPSTALAGLLLAAGLLRRRR